MGIENSLAVYALSRPGAATASRLASSLQDIRESGPELAGGEQGTLTRQVHLYLPGALARGFGATGFSSLKGLLPKIFSAYSGHVMVTAAGIAVRCISPLLLGKNRDPAVVVLDQQGEYAVSLLSGHLGGGNRLAREVADVLGGRAVITTATDTLGLPAVEELARARGMTAANPQATTQINAALTNRRELQLFDPQDRLGLASCLDADFPLRILSGVQELDPELPAVWVDWRSPSSSLLQRALVLHPPCLVAGMGCNSGTESREILGLLDGVLREAGLARASLSTLATTSLKRDEAGLILAARTLGVPMVCIESSSLDQEEAPNPSDTVRKHTGASSVCEAAAMHRAGTTRLLVEKKKSENATLALALEV